MLMLVVQTDTIVLHDNGQVMNTKWSTLAVTSKELIADRHFARFSDVLFTHHLVLYLLFLSSFHNCARSYCYYEDD